MNRFAALLGACGGEAERAARLRLALGSRFGDVTVTHPLPGVSLGWCGDAGLTALAHTEDGFALAHGSAHPVRGCDDTGIRVDDALGIAGRALQRLKSGESAVEGLAGSFMVVAGCREGQVQVAGDGSGNRVPYCSVADEELAVASHPLVCARLHGQVELDRSLEDFFLVYGFLPSGRTLYRGVEQLAPGEAYAWGFAGWCLHRPSSNTQPGMVIPVPESEDALYDWLYQVMMGCVQDQLPAAAEVGVLLGGFDSALVAAILQRLGKRVHTYSFRYADARYNQPHTDTLSRHLGCKHTWVDITPEVIAAGLQNYGEHYVQPTNWLNYVIQTVHVCDRMRSDGLDIAFSGDGCDAVFLGYPGTYKRTRSFARLPQLPSWMVAGLTGLLGRPGLDRFIGHPHRVAMTLLRATARPMPTRAFLTFRVMDETTVNALRRGARPDRSEAVESIVRSLAEPFQGLSIQRIGYAAKGLVSPNRTKLIASTDVTGVRVHSPYLHPDLRRFASRVPDHLLREEGQSRIADPGKICLMRMAERHRLLPHEIIYQPKLAAVDSPIDSWFSGALRPALDQALSGLPFTPDPRQIEALVKTTWPERLYKRHLGSTQVISDAISLLATYGAMNPPTTDARSRRCA